MKINKESTTILSQMIFTNDPKKQALYHRGSAEWAEDGGVFIKPREAVSFDTYFNAFFYGAYLRYSKVTQVRLCTVTTGNGRLVLFSLDKDGVEKELEVIECTGIRTQTEFEARCLKDLPEDGALCLKVEAKENLLRFHQGWYKTVLELDDINRIKVAAVVCTYKREKYIYGNLREVRRQIWENQESRVRGDISFFIVDNGQTIKMEELSNVMVFSNKNYGGSGGFARGLIEAYRRRDEYTHVLLMDDDISFEPETLARTIQFLKVTAPSQKPLCIGGQMLIEDEPTIQYEAGAKYAKGFITPNHQGLNLADRRDLLFNAKEYPSQYNAWWYCCFPISVIENNGLPLPLFIKFDDVEYGLRMKPQIVLMNGIGVWHMAFSEKYSVYLHYYIRRNGLLVSALYDGKSGIFYSMYKIIRSAGKAILMQDPQYLAYAIDAYRDFLKGPNFFLYTDEEELNHQLMQANKFPSKSVFKILTEFLFIWFDTILRYSRVCREYKLWIGQMISLDFWCRHLGIESVGREVK